MKNLWKSLKEKAVEKIPEIRKVQTMCRIEFEFDKNLFKISLNFPDSERCLRFMIDPTVLTLDVKV